MQSKYISCLSFYFQENVKKYIDKIFDQFPILFPISINAFKYVEIKFRLIVNRAKFQL